MKSLITQQIPVDSYKDFLLSSKKLSFYGKETNSEVYIPPPVVVSVEEVKETKEPKIKQEPASPSKKKEKEKVTEISMEPLSPIKLEIKDLNTTEQRKEIRSQSLATESVCRVNILSTYESGSGYTKHTMYEIGVKYGKEHIICAHRFKDFKKLHLELKEDYPNIPDMPSTGFGLGFSSTDPETVAERRDKLEKFLAACVDSRGIRTHPAVMEFLELNKFAMI